MNFGNKMSGMEETQEDIVKANTPVPQEDYVEDIKLPGLARIHLLEEGEMVDFFTMVLKTRRDIKQIELTLGDEYEQKEVVSNMPNSTDLANMSHQKIARVLTMALLRSDDDVIGFRAVVNHDKEGNVQSKIFIKKSPVNVSGPSEWDADGNAKDGDKEFNPRLSVTYNLTY